MAVDLDAAKVAGSGSDDFEGCAIGFESCQLGMVESDLDAVGGSDVRLVPCPLGQIEPTAGSARERVWGALEILNIETVEHHVLFIGMAIAISIAQPENI